MDYNTKSAIIGGTFFSSIVNIGVEDLITTVVLAVIEFTIPDSTDQVKK